MRRVLLAAALLVALLPLASAQLPAACGPAALNLIPMQRDVPAGSITELVGALQNRGQRAATAQVDVAEAPEGWTVTVDPTNLTLGGSEQEGSTQSFMVRIAVPVDATEQGSVTIGVVLSCSPLPVDRHVPDPVTATIVVTPAAGAGERLAGFLDSYGLVALGALVLVGLGTAVAVGVSRARGGLHADAPEPLKGVKPGRGASFPLVIENRERRNDTLRFEIGRIPAGWAAFTAAPELTLAPGERRTTWLMVRAPADAPLGSQADVPVTVRSDVRPTASRRLSFRAEVRDEPEPQGETQISP